MRVEIKYVCEMCGTVYDDKSDCEACEQGHFANLKIIPHKQYNSYEKWPRYITVQCGETGECAKYERRSLPVYD